mmetsp:Transcript_12252/g.26793  ORF Transcript_12252/g.26793 Transcript_12252/m.26793 type:complete len:270 (+) Transcript_12252:2744-3553(+)
MLVNHVGTTDGEGDGNAQWDTLGDGRDSQGYSDQDHVQPSRTAWVGWISSVHHDADDEDDDTDANGVETDDAAQLFQVLLKGSLVRRSVRQASALLLGLVVFLGGDQAGDVTDLGVHACVNNDTSTLAVGDAAPREDHVLREQFFLLSFLLGLSQAGVLADVVRLAGERHLRDLQVVGLEEAHVGRHDISGAEDDDVTSHDSRDLNLVFLSIAHNVDGSLRHFRQGLQGISGLVLRPGGDAGVEDDDDENGLAGGVGQDVSLVWAGCVH